MTALVTAETGEITETQVRASIRRVIDHAESIWDEWAWQVENKTWTVLGYRSWDEMRRGEYGALTSVSAPRAERPELVSRFRGAGLTQKQTADTLGINQATVARHDEPTYRPRETNMQTHIEPGPDDEVVDAELVEDEPQPEPTPPPAPRITGRDGKSYPKPAPQTSTPKRRPLTDAFLSATYELTKKVTTLTNLATDDRFGANKEKVATANRSDLIRARDGLDRLIEQLD